jgi:hypothetical protein
MHIMSEHFKLNLGENSTCVRRSCGVAAKQIFATKKKRANNFHRTSTQHVVKWKRRARWQFVVSTLYACCFVFARAGEKDVSVRARPTGISIFRTEAKQRNGTQQILRRVRMENEHEALLPALF